VPETSERARPSAFWPLATLIVPVVTALAKLRYVDRAKFPAHGAYIITPNHFSEIDPLIIGTAVWKLGRIPRFLAKASLFKIPVVGWLFAKTGQIPVHRESRSGVPLESAERVIEQGQLVVIYPEGTLTRDPDMWPMRGRAGAARLALEHGIPVIPVAHWGTQEVLPRYSKKLSLFPRKTVRIKFGDPVDLSRYEGRTLDNGTLAEASDDIMQAITRLVEDLRGEKAPERRWNPAEHEQTESGRFDG
jgi:1-acyl-sn-glycerol-3-phosphate acyltransferase